ncbi:hypothetical protein FF38_03846 [Lucilia cuprina]|uniref:Protein quiver n=1 Tax=Lucilia cuprina TaxID=7375 RepID=A0A0L0CMT6_LUCCU|nr:uncharacterized protein LOC111691240 [Lucilia cuprina]KAI8127052.1 hypothetical protein CVS40_2848 [Lucilia cuprina]KNC33527.1 hypothetical protein FF38_03846 [Lucilia cuprina]
MPSLPSLEKSLLVFFVLVVSMLYISDALRCYACSYTANSGANDSCVYEPKKTITCSKKYCTIIRQDLVHPVGSIVSFSRSCEDKPLYLNAVKTDTTYKMYFRSCVSDLCNDSDGKRSATNSDPNFGASENMVIKGRDEIRSR